MRKRSVDRLKDNSASHLKTRRDRLEFVVANHLEKIYADIAQRPSCKPGDAPNAAGRAAVNTVADMSEHNLAQYVWNIVESHRIHKDASENVLNALTYLVPGDYEKN